MARARCQACGAKLPAKSKFCPECGTPVASGNTVVQEVPPAEEGPTPVETHVSERRYFGVAPSGVLLGLGVVGLVAAIALFVTGLWPWGLIALGLSMFMLTGFISQTRRLPGEAPATGRATLATLGSVRARAAVAKETIAAHGSARLELARLRRDTSRLAQDRSERARELGEAVYAKNTRATKDLKEQIKEIDDQIESKEGQMTSVTMDALDRIGKAKLLVQPTQVATGETPDETPEPATVPEPFPPPDEGQPPQPAQVPEPYPPPDEGDRPKPPEIPEPGPNPAPE
ncbi:MAG TPA: zinc-ribbon domain-containing protein [Gaiellaceae bacterium]|jgi:zinc-ribbon domain